MRLAALAVAGCYAPLPPLGAPCDPTAPSCPSGQACFAENGGFHCERTAPIDAPPPSDAPPDAQLRFVYTATVAECVDPVMPNPDTCKTIKGPDQMVVDMVDAATGQPWDAFIRFDLDSAFGSAPVASVTFEVTATNDPLASSTKSGDVWEVMPFTKMDLFTAEPAKIGAIPLAPTQGAVAQLQVVRYTLPTNLVMPGGSVFLEMTTPSQDGANYWNLAGPNPPRLVVQIQ